MARQDMIPRNSVEVEMTEIERLLKVLEELAKESETLALQEYVEMEVSTSPQ